MPETPSPVVAFLGPEATYTHQAALSAFPADKYELRSQTTIQDCFELVQKEKVRYGVVPFENSSNGSVIFTLDLFVDAQNLNPDILVDGEVYLPIHHCLLSRAAPDEEHDDDNDDEESSKLSKPWRKLEGALSPESGACTPTQAVPVPQKPRVKPNKDISHVRKLYSHPQAWGQCKLFLNTYLKGVEQQDVSSTSKAAELVAQDESGTSAAISSKIAGEMNNLEMLAEGIEDKEGNTTRFLIIRNTQDVPLSTVGLPAAAVPPPSASDEIDEQSGQKYKTLVSFTVAHGEAGALADCLAVFKRYNLNLTSINSRPSTESAWHYVFFIEFQGRKLAVGGKVNKALEELGWIAKEWRWLGSWENKLI
ncbi:Putative bifunctional P-protein, chorismate mutase/prephenate dehydratase [Septoria linicola]|uniref:prephenate dehydratase n=1 Tax=Septoria linicola TaxID=215465 RepID=A0A9Q9ASL4_9PEZI|nr:putative bifunctional P-protein, chorismate mutase/prephenate dehydratase [Septoria linicola]USW51216.1 Putative bifunctional P-protein, chorismate mutase/prephenate dehydratase [Septoria linicola]